jgi:DNA-binding CsgD family transcriptional regulator
MNGISTNTLEGMRDHYFDEGWHLADWHLNAIPFLLQKGIVRDVEYTPPEVFRRHQFFRFCAEHKLGHSCILEWHLKPDDRLGMAFHRKNGEDCFDEASVRLLSVVRQRFLAAGKIMNGLAESKTRGISFGLELAGTPAIFFNRLGRITHVNAAAEKLLGVELQVFRGELRAAGSAETRAISARMKAVALSDWLRPDTGSEPISIARNGLPPILLRIERLGGAMPDIFSYAEGVVLLEAPEQSDATRQRHKQALQQRFRLSPQEAHIAIHLSEGRSLREIADGAERSYQTVRTQLKSIFLKTQTSRQVELVSILKNLE